MDGTKSSRSLSHLLLPLVIGRRPARTSARLVVLIFGTWVVFSFVLTPPIRVTGISMLPTFHDGQINFLYRLAYVRSDPKRGDIIGLPFQRTTGDHHILFKRIVGLPGEMISFHRGQLVVNDEPVYEPYVKSGCNWNMPPVRLGPTEYYVVGDNRGMDFAGHTQGVVKREEIVGRAVFPGKS